MSTVRLKSYSPSLCTTNGGRPYSTPGTQITTAPRGCEPPLLPRQADPAQEGRVGRFAAEEIAHHQVRVDRAPALEDGAAVGGTGGRVERAGRLETRVHVVAQDLGPEVAVIRGVIPEQVEEA